MVPLGAIKYIIYAALIVISLFVGLQLIFAHEMRRETWRSMLKHHVYVSQETFKRLSRLFGWFLLIFGLIIAYFQILGLMDG